MARDINTGRSQTLEVRILQWSELDEAANTDSRLLTSTPKLAAVKLTSSATTTGTGEMVLELLGELLFFCFSSFTLVGVVRAAGVAIVAGKPPDICARLVLGGGTRIALETSTLAAFYDEQG